MRAPLVALALLALPFAGCLQEPSGAGTPSAGGPETALAWRFTDTDGVEHSNATAAGAPHVLFFMATWCSTCQSKTAMLSAVERDYAEKGVRFLSVDFDPTESDDQLIAWKESRDQPWPHGRDAGRNVQRALGVTSQSSVVVLAPDGEIARSWGYGRVDGASLRAALDEVLAAGASAA